METRHNTTDSVQRYVIDILESTGRAIFYAIESPEMFPIDETPGSTRIRNLPTAINKLIATLKEQKEAHDGAQRVLESKTLSVAATKDEADERNQRERTLTAQANKGKRDAYAILKEIDTYVAENVEDGSKTDWVGYKDLYRLVSCFFEDQTAGRPVVTLTHEAAKIARSMQETAATLIDRASGATETAADVRTLYPTYISETEQTIKDVESGTLRQHRDEVRKITAEKKQREAEYAQLRAQAAGRTGEQPKLREQEFKSVGSAIARTVKSLDALTAELKNFDATVEAERTKLDGYESRLIAEQDRLQRKIVQDEATLSAPQTEADTSAESAYVEALQADVNAQAAKLRELRGTKRDVMLPYVNTTHRVPDEVQQQVAQLDADIATLQAEYTANKSELGAAQQRVAKESEKQSSKAVASRQAKLVAEIKADKKLIDDIENGLREIERRRSTFDADMAARLGALQAKEVALNAELAEQKATRAGILQNFQAQSTGGAASSPAPVEELRLQVGALNEALNEKNQQIKQIEEYLAEKRAELATFERAYTNVVSKQKQFVHSPDSFVQLKGLSESALVEAPVIRQRQYEYVVPESMRATRGKSVAKRGKLTHADFFTLVDTLIRRLSPTYLRLVGSDALTADADALASLSEIKKDTDLLPLQQEASGIAVRLQPLVADPGAALALNAFINIAITAQNNPKDLRGAREKLSDAANAMFDTALRLAKSNRSVPADVRKQLGKSLADIRDEISGSMNRLGGLAVKTSAELRTETREETQAKLYEAPDTSKQRGLKVCRVFIDSILPILFYVAKDTLTQDPNNATRVKRALSSWSKILKDSPSPWAAYPHLTEFAQSDLLTKTLPQESDNILVHDFSAALRQTRSMIEAAWCLLRTYSDPSTWKDEYAIELGNFVQFAVPAVLSLYDNQEINDAANELSKLDAFDGAVVARVVQTLTSNNVDKRIVDALVGLTKAASLGKPEKHKAIDRAIDQLGDAFSDLASNITGQNRMLNKIDATLNKAFTRRPLARLDCRPTIAEAEARFGTDYSGSKDDSRTQFMRSLANARTLYNDDLDSHAQRALNAVVTYVNSVVESMSEAERVRGALRQAVGQLAALGIDSEKTLRQNRIKSSRKRHPH